MTMSIPIVPIRSVRRQAHSEASLAAGRLQSGAVRPRVLLGLGVAAALLPLLAIVSLPAISALQGNTTASDLGAEVNKTRAIAVGDIDGDSFPDVVIANEGTELNLAYFGDGNGTFSAPINISSIHQETTDAIDLADVDQDGDLDVVIGNRLVSEPNRLYTWDAPNNRFDFRSTRLNDALFTRMTSDVRFADINQDGDPDVVVANRNAQNVVFFGSGTPGEFSFPDTDPLQDSATSDSSSVAVGNLTEDDCPDLVVGNRRNVRNDLYLNAGDCSGYALRRDLSPDADYTDWIEIADINNDGNNDVITANRLQRNKYLLGNGTSANPFQPSKAISPDADYTRDIRAVDVDGDGDLDIIAANAAPAPNKLYLNRLMESGVLGFDAAFALPSLANADAIATAVCGPPDCDLDGDGDVDLVFGNNGPIGSNLGAINRIVFNNNENPFFTSDPIEGATITFPYTYEVTAFDPDRAQVLTITGTGLGWLTLVDHGDGTATLSGQPGANLAAVLTVTDEDGLSANQNLSIAVSASNLAPAISSGAAPTSVTQDTDPATPSYAHLFTATDADNAGNTLDFSAPTLPSWMTLVDNGDGTANLSGTPVQGDVGDHAVIVRVTDPAGRVAEESFVVTVVDGNDRPVAVNDNIQMSNGATVTRLGPQEPDLDSASLLWNDTDADDDVLVASLFTQATAGTATVNADGTFQYVHGGGGAGLDSFEYRVTDNKGGQIRAFVNIAIDVAVDTEAPVITLLGDAVVTVIVGGAYTDAGATASDNVDGNITANIVTSNPVNTNTVASYTVRYNVSDAAGNAAAEVTRTVNVVAVADSVPPVITRLGNATVSVTVGAAYTDAGATAVDDVDGDITANIVVTNPVNTAVAGTYTVLYNVSDAAGNNAVEVARTVTVSAVAPPPPPPPPARSSGGGSSGVLELLGMILLVGMSRRRMRLTRRSI